MIALFMNKYFWIFLSIIIVGFLLIFLARKYEVVKWIALAFITLAFVGTSVYSIINLNIYYSAQGGIWGYISSSVNVKPEVEVNDLEFSFKNLELLQDGDTETYSVRINSEQLVELDPTKDYALFVNSNITTTVDAGADYIFSNYRYVFYSEEKQVMLDDILKLRFVFNLNSTYLTVSTDGGSTAAKYWTSYFKKNDFVVSIEEAFFDQSEGYDFVESYRILNVTNADGYVYVTNEIGASIYKMSFSSEETISQSLISEKIINSDYENCFTNMNALSNLQNIDKQLPFCGAYEAHETEHKTYRCNYLKFDARTNSFTECVGVYIKYNQPNDFYNTNTMRILSACSHMGIGVDLPNVTNYTVLSV